MNKRLPKLSIVLNVFLEDEFACIDNGPSFAVIPISKDVLRNYLNLIEYAQTSNIPNLNALSISDYSPYIVNHNFREEHDLPALDMLREESIYYLNDMKVIPTPSLAELDKHSLRVEVSELQVPPFPYSSPYYTGYIKHTDLRYSTTSIPDCVIEFLITEFEQFEAKAEEITLAT